MVRMANGLIGLIGQTGIILLDTLPVPTRSYTPYRSQHISICFMYIYTM